MSNLTHSLRSSKSNLAYHDEIDISSNNDSKLEEKFTEKYSNRHYLFVMDNARVHTAKKVREQLLESYNVLFLPPYTPYLNVKQYQFIY